MLKIDNESLTDKTTVIWENESGIMSTFTLKIETHSEDLGDIKLEIRTTLTKDELDEKVRFLPLPADVGYHSPTPLYEGQTVCSDHCEYLDGKPCYYDGSGLFAEEVYQKLVEGGSDEVWKILEERYMELFGELR